MSGSVTAFRHKTIPCPDWGKPGHVCDPCTCGGGQQPPWNWWGQNLRSCWSQIKELKEIISDIIEDMGGPISTGPISGVVDGSNATAGQVGEYFVGNSTGSFATTANQTQTLSPLVLSPGDWDVQGCLWVDEPVNGIYFYLNPVPTGIATYPIGSNTATPLVGTTGSITAVPSEGLWVHTSRAQASLSVPTLLPFTLITNTQSAGTAAGSFTLFLSARRMR
jgi:hypothetical protein